MSPIKEFKLKYQAPNKENTFAEGDTIIGQLTFTLTEETKVKSIYVKAKGDAIVHWSDGTGEKCRSHHAHKRFYKTKEYLVAEKSDGTALQKGDHCYKFQLQIPNGNIPPSFKGFHGKILHVLQAKLTRSWHPSTKETTELRFGSRSCLPVDQSPQTGSVDKELGTFSKGQLHMTATVNKKVCSPGDTLTVTANIKNKTSKKMKMKFSVDQKTVYRAFVSAKIQHGTVCKVVAEAIAPDFEGSVTSQITIPPDTYLSIHNCEIINVEYYIKAYLDISFSFDPEVKLPLIIVPSCIAAHFGQNPGLFPAGAQGGPGYFPPPAPASGSYPYSVPPAPPNAYPYPPPGPNMYPNMPGGYNQQMPPQPTPYGYPAVPYMPHPMAPQVNTMNPQYQPDQALPSYMSIYPPTQSETETEN